MPIVCSRRVRHAGPDSHVWLMAVHYVCAVLRLCCCVSRSLAKLCPSSCVWAVKPVWCGFMVRPTRMDGTRSRLDGR